MFHKCTEQVIIFTRCCMLCLFRTKHSSLKFSLNNFILGIAYNGYCKNSSHLKA